MAFRVPLGPAMSQDRPIDHTCDDPSEGRGPHPANGGHDPAVAVTGSGFRSPASAGGLNASLSGVAPSVFGVNDPVTRVPDSAPPFDAPAIDIDHPAAGILASPVSDPAPGKHIDAPAPGIDASAGSIRETSRSFHPNAPRIDHRVSRFDDPAGGIERRANRSEDPANRTTGSPRATKDPARGVPDRTHRIPRFADRIPDSPNGIEAPARPVEEPAHASLVCPQRCVRSRIGSRGSPASSVTASSAPASASRTHRTDFICPGFIPKHIRSTQQPKEVPWRNIRRREPCTGTRSPDGSSAGNGPLPFLRSR